jgi:hypothetical protein
MTGVKTLLAGLALGLCLCLGGLAQAATAAPEPSARQVLVLLRLPAGHFHPNADYADSYGDGAGLAARRRIADRIAHAHGLTLVDSWPIPSLGVDCYVMAAPGDESLEQIAAVLAKDPNVAGAEPMHLYRAQAEAPGEPTHNDPLYRTQPAAREWRLAELHGVATGRGVKVAVIDSQVDAAHPDLVGQIATSQNFVSGHGRAAEQHGTGVAGVIAGVADNHIGIAGVAPRARLMALRACWQQPGRGATVCDTLSLAKAIQFAIDNKAQVINLSLAGPNDLILGRLIDIAVARGAAVVGAMDPSIADGGFPASHSGVVAVAEEGPLAPAGAFTAPGHDVPTTEPGGRYALVSGSSYAAAHVSGLLALLREQTRSPGPMILVTFKPGGGPIDTCATLQRAARPACQGPGAYSTVARQ